ncbi:MAG: nuclear transport factor 2 family protein [Thermoleophilia bacterium]
MDRAALHRWLTAYEAAWRAPGTGALGALFAEDAVYLTSPVDPPVRGLDAIRGLWERGRDAGEEFGVEWEIVAIDGDTGVVRLRVDYRAPEAAVFRDLWIIRLGEDGRCRHFEEWYAREPSG